MCIFANRVTINEMTMKNQVPRFLNLLALIAVVLHAAVSCASPPEVYILECCANGDRFEAEYLNRFGSCMIDMQSSSHEFCTNDVHYYVLSENHCESADACDISSMGMQLRVILSRIKFPTNAMHIKYVHDGVNVNMELRNVSVCAGEPLNHYRCNAIVKSGEIFFVEYRPKYPYYRATFEIEADLELLSDDGAVMKTVPLHITDGRLEYGYPVGQ